MYLVKEAVGELFEADGGNHLGGLVLAEVVAWFNGTCRARIN